MLPGADLVFSSDWLKNSVFRHKKVRSTSLTFDMVYVVDRDGGVAKSPNGLPPPSSWPHQIHPFPAEARYVSYTSLRVLDAFTACVGQIADHARDRVRHSRTNDAVIGLVSSER